MATKPVITAKATAKPDHRKRIPKMKGKNKIHGVTKVMKTWPGFCKLLSSGLKKQARKP